MFIAQPYLGTDLYQDFKSSGLLNEGFLDASSFIKTKYKTKYFSSEELNDIRKIIYIQFYLRKILRYSSPFIFYNEFLYKIKNLEDLKYTFKIFKNLLTDFFY